MEASLPLKNLGKKLTLEGWLERKNYAATVPSLHKDHVKCTVVLIHHLTLLNGTVACRHQIVKTTHKGIGHHPRIETFAFTREENLSLV